MTYEKHSVFLNRKKAFAFFTRWAVLFREKNEARGSSPRACDAVLNRLAVQTITGRALNQMMSSRWPTSSRIFSARSS
jgi:hypothetical protein